MRILFVADASMTAFTTYLDTLAPALAARGHEVHVLRCGDRVEPYDVVERSHVVHHRQIPRLRGGSRLRILNHRIDVHLQNISPLGHVLGDDCKIARLDEMPAES